MGQLTCKDYSQTTAEPQCTPELLARASEPCALKSCAMQERIVTGRLRRKPQGPVEFRLSEVTICVMSYTNHMPDEQGTTEPYKTHEEVREALRQYADL